MAKKKESHGKLGGNLEDAHMRNSVSAANKDIWIKSPITKENHVLVEYDDTNGASSLCIGSGFFTNEYPLNYKKHPDFDIDKYENGMPKLMKELRFDDGESYWYPTTIQHSGGMVYPEGTKEKWYWTYTPIKMLSKEESNTLSDGNIEYESKLEVSETKRFDRFLDACKEMGGLSFNVKA